MEAVIKVSNLVQGKGQRLVLNGIDFEVMPGECFGVFGTRGAGKTSLLHILAGIDSFRSGEVTVLGCNVRTNESFKASLGLVTQARSLFLDLTAYENLDFFAALKNAPRSRIDQVSRSLALDECLDTPVGSLDAGLFQRLSLACALLNAPQMLIADELIKDIDLDSRQILLTALGNFLSGGGTCVWGFSDIGCCPHMSRVGWLEEETLSILSPEQAAREWERRLRQVAANGSGRDEDHA